MLYLNRTVIVIKPKQPFVDWANSVEPEGRMFSLEGFKNDNSVYLIPAIDDTGDVNKTIKKRYKIFFINELESWYTDKKTWPKKITYALFQKWFDVEYHTMVADLAAGFPIEYEEG